MSEWEAKIHLSSRVIDTAAVVNSFINSDKGIEKCVFSKSDSEIEFEGLSICSNEPLFHLAPRPIQSSIEVFSNSDNSFDIRFQDCDEFAVGEVYDRLLYALSGIYDHIAANAILSNLKELVHNTNPLFGAAKVDRLLGYKSPLFEQQSIIVLSDICNMESWSISVSVAEEIYNSLEKQIKLLAVPSAAIQSLTSDLSEREKYIVENRYLKADKTLEELGSELGLTRERVRQIAAKVVRKLKAPRKLNLIKAVFSTLKVLCECEYCFNVNELNNYEVSENALMFLSEVLGSKYILAHISETDYIALNDKDGKCGWLEHIEKVAVSIPTLLLREEQLSIVKEVASTLAETGFVIPNKIILAIAFRKYYKDRTALVKKSLHMGDRYEIVLGKLFPDGIRLYQAEDMQLFRKGYAELFDDDRIPDNDHAIVSRIIDRCVLVDRGTYILNKKTELPAELYRRILEFILQYPFDMVMTNAIMHHFNAELTSIGIDNKYYLLSVLKQEFSDNFTFRRDYVIKGDATGSLYGNITGFVESNPEGVNFRDLQIHFQGIPDAVLYFALSEDNDIIPMYNKMYIHKSNIIFPEKHLILELLKKVVSQENIVSDERAYGLLRREYPDFIANNNINTSWFLFSILRSFFQDEFKFSRPHIIDSSFDSANGREALRGSFWGKKYVDIADIKNYAKEKQIQIYDLSKLLDSYNDKYFILNKERLIRIDEIGYSTDEFSHVEDIVIQALGDLEYAEIAKLNVVNSLPETNVSLTEWLIYSIINKYGTQISAITSTPQFMSSVPLVIRNSVDKEYVRDDYASSETATQTVKTDDLSDIDSLIEGIIDLSFV
jgi:DNA-binding CsgD family transcriptional regulator